LLSCVAVTAGVAAEADADAASLRGMLAAALEANERLSALAEELGEDNERLRADLAVLQRMLFGRSSERARAGRRDYSHLPRVEVTWAFGDGYCCPECGTSFTGLGSDHVAEQLD
jgi:transposase